MPGDSDSNLREVFVSKIISTDVGIFLVFESLGDKKSYELELFESTAISFFYTGYSAHSHIKTIHQIFETFLVSSGYDITQCLIEGYKDEIGFAKVCLYKNGQNLSFMCGIADAIIFSLMCDVPLNCREDVWDQLQNYDDDDDIESDYNQEY